MHVTHNFAMCVNCGAQLRSLVCSAVRSASVQGVQYEMFASCFKTFNFSPGDPHNVKRHYTTLAYSTVLKVPSDPWL
jgi:hypothetical protein